MIEKLNNPPISGQYEEVFFDLQDPWRGKEWHYVLFTDENGSKWCGHFREKEISNFLTAELPNKGIACIVAGGHGYLVDVNKREKIRDLSTDPIISLIADYQTSSFFITTYWDLILIDTNLNELEISLPIQADGIYLKEIEGRKLKMQIEEIGADMKMNFDFYIDLTDNTVKKYLA
ncbi:hypothetical protein [uncultured Pontibacter sp.]|uniref:hypothetical protein n=1 Tax=uncultured Pontibacter sp. TaxID=453356 RepID=UPI00260F1180|nr:hypothetical protein [uncultured Pontibacter sp.]